MNKLISVIVPVYNVERYLPACLNSVLSQSYRDLEIILIDDGSTDHSGRICDEYADKDSRIRVIHQANGGAAAAKNTGLRAASGKYLSFVDSDDYLEPGAYEHMVSRLQMLDADIIQCGFRYVYTDSANDIIRDPVCNTFTAADFLPRFTTDWTSGLLWNKLYRRSVFQDVFFEEGHRIDDEYFTYQGIMNASKVVCDGRIVYNYRQRRSGVMRSPESARQILLDRIDFLSKRRCRVICRFPDLRQVFDRHFLEMMVILSKDPNRTEQSVGMIRAQLSSYFRETGHTPADIRLWPALAKLRLGVLPAPTEDAPSKHMSPDRFFE